MIKSSMTDEERKAIEEAFAKAKKDAEAIREQIKPMAREALAKIKQALELAERDVEPFTHNYWERKQDIQSLFIIYDRLMEYLTDGKCRKTSRLCDLYVIDKCRKQIHRVGEYDHDSLCTSLGYVDYYNMQCGDGGGVDSEDGYGYAILQSHHGSLCDEFGIVDREYVKEILEYLKEQGEDISVFDDEGRFIREDVDNTCSGE